MSEIEPRESRRMLPRAALAAALALAAAGAEAGEGKWTLKLQPIFMEAHGHDQHVLTIQEIEFGETLEANSTAVTLDTESGQAYRFELQYKKEKWGCGFDFLWFNTSQGRPSRSASASGPNAAVIFDVADQSFVSVSPNEVLFYDVLEDTDLAIWTLDLYALKTLAQSERSGLHLRFGLRVGDFDNDYRAVVGVRDVGGARLDASSNYGQMFGPVVGLAADVHRGKNAVEAYLGQAVILGSPELAGMSRNFAGPFGETPAFFTRETFQAKKDVAIPITELRIQWTYRVSRLLRLGVGTESSVWWDVSVPPGVIPGTFGDQVLHENTLVFFGLLGTVHLTF